MLIRAGGGVFRKLSMSYDDLVTIPGYGPSKIDASYSLGGAKLTVQTVERFLKRARRSRRDRRLPGV